VGQLVVLRTLWNLQSYRIGVVVEVVEQPDKLLVMWTTKNGYELKMHIRDALTPITNANQDKIKERSCVFK